MKANELMIGDWVNFLIDIEVGDTENDPQNEVYQPMQVGSISSLDEISAAFFGVNNDITQLQPIPITEDILDKNFKDIAEPHQRIYGGRWVYFDNCFEVDIHIYKNGVCAITVEDCHLAPCWNMFAKYVHQLQHALRLCNIEKEIEL